MVLIIGQKSLQSQRVQTCGLSETQHSWGPRGYRKCSMELDEGVNAIIHNTTLGSSCSFVIWGKPPAEPGLSPPALSSNQYSDSAPHLHFKLSIRLACTDVMEDYMPSFSPEPEEPDECVFDCGARCELLLRESLFTQMSAAGPDHYYSSLMRRHNTNGENTARQAEAM